MFERPKSLTELVTDTLHEWIVSGRLEMGSRVSEARLAKEMQVSRTPVREAINRLEMEGLLYVEPQRGAFVFSLERDELIKICDVRVCLETAAMSAAIKHNPAKLHKALLANTQHMVEARETGDDQAYLALDTQFHQLLFDYTENPFLNDAYQVISQKMAAVRNKLGGHPDHMAKSFIEHKQIAEKVGEKDEAGAIEILANHIDRKEGSYWDLATSNDDIRQATLAAEV